MQGSYNVGLRVKTFIRASRSSKMFFTSIGVTNPIYNQYMYSWFCKGTLIGESSICATSHYIFFPLIIASFTCAICFNFPAQHVLITSWLFRLSLLNNSTK
jgi:hypothetical protein